MKCEYDILCCTLKTVSLEASESHSYDEKRLLMISDNGELGGLMIHFDMLMLPTLYQAQAGGGQAHSLEPVMPPIKEYPPTPPVIFCIFTIQTSLHLNFNRCVIGLRHEAVIAVGCS